MEAPDKIYVDTEIIAFYELEVEAPEDTVYLRKDTLLKWAKIESKTWKESVVYKYAMRRLIDKLNSM